MGPGIDPIGLEIVPEWVRRSLPLDDNRTEQSHGTTMTKGEDAKVMDETGNLIGGVL